jgi:tetratricopeptide (TPR) repeat protein/transcriptional regulator with XRE-family HTH domain
VVDGPAPGRAGLGFGGLLRQLRDKAGLTQDELAEAARVSQRAISDLERGINATARKDTAVLLAGALGLDGPARELFIAAARGRAPADKAREAGTGEAGTGKAGTGSAAAASRTLPRDITAFTGRQDELSRLMARWAEAAAGGTVVSVHAIGGMAGIGKTTFAVHAAHRLADSFPDGQFFLPLHAHTPGQRPIDPADALASLLLTAGVPAHQIPPGLDARSARWRDHAADKKVLLVLDDAAGHRQVRPLLPGTPGSLVLITSRRRLTALEDSAVVSLDTLAPAEAADLLARLASRADVTAHDPGVAQLAALCGYLPLAIGMTGRQLAHHPAWTAPGLAVELAAAKDRLELMAAEDLSVAAAFGLSYQDLDADQQRLFRRLGLHPGPDIDAYAAAALDGSGVAAARRRLDALYDQHLITEPAPGRYRFHDLIREHARTLAAADDAADSDVAAGRLLNYYLHSARAASVHFPSWTNVEGPAPPGREPGSAPPVSTLAQAAGWLEAERANLHAAASYAAATRSVYTVLIPAAMDGFLQTRGYWDQGLALHQAALAAARQAGDRVGQALALMLLSPMQTMTEDTPAAVASATRALQLYRDLGDRTGQAAALHMLGFLHTVTDDYPAAAAELRQALELFRGLGHRRGQGDALHYLGAVHRYTGNYPAAADCQRQALELFCDTGYRTGQANALMHLGAVQQLAGDYPTAATNLLQALALCSDLGDRHLQAQVLFELAAVQRLTGDYPAATASSRQALSLYRQFSEGFSDMAYVLNELGLVQQLTGDYLAAAASHQQALALCQDINRTAQAETLNCLGELSSRTADGRQARDDHAQALAIARDLGVPAEEARALEGIGRSHLRDGNPTQAAAPLRDALAIYQRIGGPAARRVEETLKSGLTATGGA